MLIRVIHAFKKWEELSRDILELSKMKDRISNDREYSVHLKESFQREISKLLEQRAELLKLKIQSKGTSIPQGKDLQLPEGRKLYEEKESRFREEVAGNATNSGQKSKNKPERPVYKY